MRWTHAAALGAALFPLACGTPPPERPGADPTSRRATVSGEVVGFTSPYGSHAWLGLPYAQPPVGPLRWRAPRPNDAWSGVREALDHGSWCPQLGSSFAGNEEVDAGMPVGEEDCLYLDVYAPRLAADAVPRGEDKLPVMVWFHGGGNVVGSAAFYDGGNLAATHDVLVVMLNYRLGPLGWFRHASLRRSGTAEDHSGNFGTLDLIRGLEWVRDHASAFGGDPGNVTIFGESAGGRDVFSLLVSPRARGLFQRAIVQSGGTESLPLPAAENLADADPPGRENSSGEVLLRLLQADGASDRAEAKSQLAAMSHGSTEAYLRGKSPHDLSAAYATEEQEGLIDVPQLFRDGLVLPDRDGVELLAEGSSYNRVPVILGTNRDEHRIFLFANRENVQWLLWLVPRLRDPDAYFATADHLSRLWKATGADLPAAALTRRQGTSVYVYRFDWDEEPSLLGADLGAMLGASHAFEIPFVFGHWYLGRRANRLFDTSNQPGREELSAKMMSYWAQFAYTGSPGRGREGELPAWDAFGSTDAGSGRFAVLDTEADGGIRMASGGATKASAVAAVDKDARLPSQRDKCAVYREFVRFGRGFGDRDYPGAGARGCADFPLDEHPWGG